MKSLHLFLVLSLACLVIMIVVDYLIGARAEFVNAWSVVQRLSGQSPGAGDSLLAQKLGGMGELAAVLIINMLLGGMLTVIVSYFTRK